MEKLIIEVGIDRKIFDELQRLKTMTGCAVSIVSNQRLSISLGKRKEIRADGTKDLVIVPMTPEEISEIRLKLSRCLWLKIVL